MKKNYLIIIILFLLFLTMFSLNYFSKKPIKVCFENNCFDLEVAETREQRKQGLMFREKLDPNKGMLFIYQQEAIYPFWMKNTLISLDIIWINKENQVVYISQNNQPCQDNDCFSINPDKKAKYVLEINAGKAAEINLKVGDQAVFLTGFSFNNKI
jgi:uncharacterized protein